MAFLLLVFSGLTPDLIHFGDLEKPSTTLLIIVALGYLFKPLYFTTEIFLAASPGKMMLGMIIGSDKPGVPPTADMLATRWLLKNSPDLIAVFGVLSYNLPVASDVLFTLASVASFILVAGFISVLGKNKQGLHDKLSHTAVYNRDEYIKSLHTEPVGEKAQVQQKLPPTPETSRALEELIWK